MFNFIKTNLILNKDFHWTHYRDTTSIYNDRYHYRYVYHRYIIERLNKTIIDFILYVKYNKVIYVCIFVYIYFNYEVFYNQWE